MKKLPLVLVLLAAPTFAGAAMNGQIINCDAPDPAPTGECHDNWALDLIDQTKTEIQAALSDPYATQLPRDRKHYFNATGAGVHVFMVDSGIEAGTQIDGSYVPHPEFGSLGSPATSRIGIRYRASQYGNVDGDTAGGHGTRTASLAAGLRHGVAKGATIHPVRVHNFISAGGWRELRDSLVWVKAQIANGMKPAVVNMSFNIKRSSFDPSTDHETQLTTAVLDIINAGGVVVASAGNANGNAADYWPSNMSQVIVVGGIDVEGNRWVRDSSEPDYHLCTSFADCGSNKGSTIDVWAPAQHIRAGTTYENDDYHYNDPHGLSDPQVLRVRSGTSYAAPLVTGVAALYLQTNPTATAAQVSSWVRSNGAALGDVDGNGTTDYLVRSPVVVSTASHCNILQRLFTAENVPAEFTSADFYDSCPAGYDAYAQYNASHGAISLLGFGPGGALYNYTPASGYTGLDGFNYTIYNTTGGIAGTGTTQVTVQDSYDAPSY